MRDRQRKKGRKKGIVLSVNVMKVNGRRDEESDAAVSPVQYVGQTTIIVQRFLVYIIPHLIDREKPPH